MHIIHLTIKTVIIQMKVKEIKKSNTGDFYEAKHFV